MLSILSLAGGLLSLIVAHILLGTISALFKQEWNWTTCWHGLVKGAIVIVAFGLVYLAGWLCSDFVVFEVNGNMVNLETAVYYVLLAGFAYYGGTVLVQIKNIVTSSIKNLAAKNETATTSEGTPLQEESEKEKNT